MACGPALWERCGSDPQTLPDDYTTWDIEAYYLAQALTAYIYTLAPERIVLGGYRIDEYIVGPGLGDRTGALGALGLADTAAR